MPLRTPLLAACITIFIAACSREDPETRPDESKPVAVSVARVAAREHSRIQNLPGTVHPTDQASLASRLMATVKSIDVSIGQNVHKGDLLVTLAANEIAAQSEQAEAALAQLERNYERESILLEKNATSAETVRSLEDQIRIAKARLLEVQTMESYTRIRAPFDGTTTARFVREGDLATPGTPLLAIEGHGNLEVYVQVPDSLPRPELGQKIEIQANKATLYGTLSEWSPAADTHSRTRLAKIKLPSNADLRSGQYVNLVWPTERTRSLWIPKATLTTIGQLERVFVLEKGILRLRLIKTGKTSDESVQILAGLNEGDSVVLAPDPSIKDGTPATLAQ